MIWKIVVKRLQMSRLMFSELTPSKQATNSGTALAESKDEKAGPATGFSNPGVMPDGETITTNVKRKLIDARNCRNAIGQFF